MGIFATRTRPGEPDGSEAGATAGPRGEVPPEFTAVRDALAAGVSPVEACTVVGRALALDGVPLGEALDGLRAVYHRVRRGDPEYAATQAVAVAWSEATLAYLHGLSCEDPMTGLASLAHVRSRLGEVYRAQGRESLSARDTHALVVLDLPPVREGGPADTFTHAFRAHRLGETARTVFAGGETIARIGPGRLVVLTPRDGHLGRRIGLVRRLLDGPEARVWIEGLPDQEDTAGLLLDELVRA
ncbi:MAG: hypothetical protein ACXVW4_00315 [Nocardioides sp.]